MESFVIAVVLLAPDRSDRNDQTSVLLGVLSVSSLGFQHCTGHGDLCFPRDRGLLSGIISMHIGIVTQTTQTY